MPQVLPEKLLRRAQQAVENAQRVRKVHRRRSTKGSEQREADLRLALERLRDAMKPLRSEIGRFPYGPSTPEAERNRERIYEASRAIQAERRKLWKMLKRN
jgi:hypothetical protein